jgi:hypothetical protein
MITKACEFFSFYGYFSVDAVFVFLMALGFELRASCLLGRHNTA